MRLGHLALVVVEIFTNFLEGCFGLIAGALTIALTIFSGGTITKTYSWTFLELKGFNLMIARPFEHLIKAINPAAKFNITINSSSQKINCKGFITRPVRQGFKYVIKCNKESNSLICQHIVARVLFLFMAVACLISRLVEAIIGAVAAILCVFLQVAFQIGGFNPKKLEKLNEIAFLGLEAPGFINDCVYCITKFVNPWARQKLTVH